MARSKGTKKTARLSVSLESKAHQVLIAWSEQEDISAAWLIRRAVNEMIERRQKHGTIKQGLSSGPSGLK
jgi:predicted transcriptional regulator